MDKLDLEAQLRDQLAQLGEQFLQRTKSETAILQTMIERLSGGDTTALIQLDHFSHKIHGSAATFGFTSISECARDIEQLVGTIMKRDGPAAADIASKELERLMCYRQLLAQQVEAAALRTAAIGEAPIGV
jgi:HPt (histidine-containing phosphotransfer) domain-containing protein